MAEDTRPDYDQPLKAWLGQAHDAFLALAAPISAGLRSDWPVHPWRKWSAAN